MKKGQLESGVLHDCLRVMKERGIFLLEAEHRRVQGGKSLFPLKPRGSVGHLGRNAERTLYCC